MKVDLSILEKVMTSAVGPPAPAFDHQAAAVSLLFFDKEETFILGILKADRGTGYPWSNQVALPGGLIDTSDPSPLHAAKRELEEELCICGDNVTYFGSIGHFQTLQNKVIEVFAGVWNQKDALCFDPGEIARVIPIPLSAIVHTHTTKGLSGRLPAMHELLYPVEDVVVWGVTAKILHFTLEQLYPFIRKNDTGL
jgi:8-oxo-dGTP pyrophosphatase MutT (NUDIX family)